MKLLNPRNDLVFKLLFTRNPELLRKMLEAVLAQPIAAIEILNPDIPGDLSADKQIVLDILVLLANGSRVDVEMQVRVTSETPSRLVYYAARDYSQQLARGESYSSLTPTQLIVWLDQPLFPHVPQFHRIFELRERHSGELFSNHLALHVLQLRDWKISNTELVTESSPSVGAALARWARFLSVDSEEQLHTLAQEDPVMTLAANSLLQISLDPQVARLAREREDSQKLYAISLAMTRQEGKAEGLQEGKAEGLQEGKAEGLQEGKAEGLQEGKAEGLQEGKAEGLQEGVQESILQICHAFNIELTAVRRSQLDGSVDELRHIVEHLLHHRAWPPALE